MTDGRRGSISKPPAELVRRLSPRRRELVRPVLANPRDYVLLSSRKLGDALGVDAMAVLRAIRRMGFEGYDDFRRYLHELALVQATQIDPMKVRPAGNGLAEHLRASLSTDMNNLSALRQIDAGRLQAVARRLHEARRIVLLGGDVASVLANFLQYNLAIIDLPALACTRPGEVVHAVRPLGKADVVIGMTFRRGLRQTVEGIQQARQKGAYCVAITDTHLSPLARFAHECFVAPVESTLYGVSYVAPMALLNMLLIACAATRKKRTRRMLEAAEEEQRTGFRWHRDDGGLPQRRAAATSSRPRRD